MLGRADEAIEAGLRAVELLPISADALDGPLIATNLAAIYAQLGCRDKALETLERAASQTAGPTPGTLRAEPQWDPLRDDPRFQKLL
jgi:serine/threonine-protein kinase